MAFPYSVGRRVCGIYLGEKGTTLANGTVTAVERRPDGRYWVTVQLDTRDKPKRYNVSRSGACDSLEPEPFEFPNG